MGEYLKMSLFENVGAAASTVANVANSMLYNDTEFEPEMTSKALRVFSIAYSVFLAYKVCQYIKSDALLHERIYNNFSNTSMYKGFLSIFICGLGIVYGPSAIMRAIFS